MTGKHTDRDAAARRISLPGPEDMTPEQRSVYDKVVNGPRGTMVGPLRAVIHSPDLANRWQLLGEFCRYRTSLPEPLTELAILVTARHWNSELEWTIHRGIAERAGLDPDIIDTIRACKTPTFADVAQSEVYAFAHELQTTGRVSDDNYAPIMARWGECGVVELTAVIGYYTMVAMMLNTHHVPLPENLTADLNAGPAE